MVTQQRKCILQETLIRAPSSWDSLTFHSHTVIRYQLSVQGERLGSPGGREGAGSGVAKPPAPSARDPAAARAGEGTGGLRPAPNPSHPTHTCCNRTPTISPGLDSRPGGRGTVHQLGCSRAKRLARALPPGLLPPLAARDSSGLFPITAPSLPARASPATFPP